jgi:hypothetical protein
MASAQELLGFERHSSLIDVEAIPSPSQDLPKLADTYRQAISFRPDDAGLGAARPLSE